MRMLGLVNAKDTIVGDVFTRGVSGGERRRVTLGEMLCGSQDVCLLDSISNGLDSSTAYDIVDTLYKATRTFGKTIVCALLQPSPEVYDLFDKVIVMASGGRIVYQVRPLILEQIHRLMLRPLLFCNTHKAHAHTPHHDQLWHNILQYPVLLPTCNFGFHVSTGH